MMKDETIEFAYTEWKLKLLENNYDLMEDFDGFSSKLGFNAGYRLMEAKQEEEIKQLKAFVNEVISDTCEGGGYDGGELQDLMIKHGLIIPTMVYENCGEYCACAENCTTEEFEKGEVECYRKAEFLK